MHKNFVRGLRIAISISIVAIIALFLLTSEKETWSNLRRLDLTYLPLAILAVILSWLIAAFRIMLLVRIHGEKIGLNMTLKMIMATNFVSSITPGRVGGGPVQILILSKKNIVPPGKAIAVVVEQGFLELVFFAITGPIAFFMSKNIYGNDKDFIAVSWAFILLFLILTTILLLSLFRVELFSNVIEKILDWSLLRRLFSEERIEKVSAQLHKEVEEFHDGMWFFIRRGGIKAVLALLCTALRWMTIIYLVMIILKGMGQSVPFLPIFIRQIAFYFLTLIAPTPGATGISEAGLAAFFVSLIPSYLLGAFVAIWSIFTFYTNLIVGGIVSMGLWRELQLARELSESS